METAARLSGHGDSPFVAGSSGPSSRAKCQARLQTPFPCPLLENPLKRKSGAHFKRVKLINMATKWVEIFSYRGGSYSRIEANRDLLSVPSTQDQSMASRRRRKHELRFEFRQRDECRAIFWILEVSKIINAWSRGS